MGKEQIKLTKEENIAVLTFDNPHKKVNLLDEITLKEMAIYVENINSDPSIQAVLLISGKPDNFIAGADVHQFENISAEQASSLSKNAHALLNKIANSTKPYVAAIHGACFGGGLEVALACHFRIATSDKKTVFAFPEVMLGILPAAGGTQRLPRIIGLQPALELLLTGKRIGPKKAKYLGLLDFVVRTREELESSAIGFIQQVLREKKSPKFKKLFFWSWVTLFFAKRAVLKKTKGHYPAPLAIIEVIKAGIHGFSAGLRQESQEFGGLIEGPVAKNLIRLFFLQKSHQKDIRAESQKTSIGVAGSGFMGAGIATISLLREQQVLLYNKDNELLAKAEAHIWGEFKKNISKEKITPFEVRRQWSNLTTITSDLQPFSKCDVIIEAIIEDVAAKQELLARCEAVMSNKCIFASNTSSIPIAEIAEHSPFKDRIIGMHYFGPVEKMPLIEIVKTKETSEETLNQALHLAALQKKTVIVVNDGPGFYTTRTIAALFDEAFHLLLEGHSPQEIDHALTKIGFPMGPLELIDQVGLDVGYHVSLILQKRLGPRLISLDLGIYKTMVDAGYLGYKSGKGFYLYVGHKKILNPQIKSIIETQKKHTRTDTPSNADIGERMLLRMVNEAAFCFSEKIILTQEDGDIGAVFGLGFPPYLGGPFQYIKDQGPLNVEQKLNKLFDVHGQRFLQAHSINHKHWQ